MLQLKSLACHRNNKTLFSNVDFVVQAGQALQIIGPNGCGKSTLLRAIAGLIRPFAGQVLCAPDICYIGHKAGLHPDLTVLENLHFLQALSSDKNAIQAEIVNTGLDYFRIQHKKHVKYGDLSAGQCQRVSLVRLCMTSAKVWLLDEPLANLDAEASVLFCGLCIRHLTSGGIIVVATHNSLELFPYEVMSICLENHK